MLTKSALYTFTALTALSLPAMAEQTEITVYNQNTALIKQTQDVDLTAGQNEVAFPRIARDLYAESVLINGENIEVLEQNYDTEGQSYLNLLNAYLGKEVTTVRTNPDDGKNIFETATLLALNGTTPVLQFSYGIEADFKGRILFPEMPKNLYATPTLKAKIKAQNTGTQPLRLAYLTGGFSWTPNYVVHLNSATDMSFLGRAAVTNASGSDYDDVRLSFVAGDLHVNRAQNRPQRMLMTTAMRSAVSADSVMAAPSALNSFYIYKINEAVSLKNGQMKQLSFVNAPHVTYEKQNELTAPLYLGVNKASFTDKKPDIVYTFKNEAMGVPLPAGAVNFYENDSDGALQFIGAGNIPDTAVDKELRVVTGTAFDVYGGGEITELRKTVTPANACQSTYAYTVTYKLENKSNTGQNLTLKQPLPTNGKVVSESETGTLESGNIRQWKFTLPAKSSKDLSVQYSNVITDQKCEKTTRLQ